MILSLLNNTQCLGKTILAMLNDTQYLGVAILAVLGTILAAKIVGIYGQDSGYVCCTDRKCQGTCVRLALCCALWVYIAKWAQTTQTARKDDWVSLPWEGEKPALLGGQYL